MNKITIKRGSDAVLQLPLGEAVYSSQVMGEECIEATLSVREALELQVGDRLLHNGVEFVLFDEPDHTHQDGTYTYPIRFYAPYYVFGFVKHKHERAIDISYCGTLAQHLAMLLDDIQQAGTGSGATASCYTGFRVEWGSVDQTAVQHIEFGDGTCLEALGKICETYGLEYRFSGKSLCLSAAEQAVDPDAAWPSFEYGKGKGLYSLERQGISNENVATRLYVYGSDRNLPHDYRENDTPRPVKLTIPSHYIDANTSKYGVREQTVTNDEIFPRLKGVKVTGTPEIKEKTCTFHIRFADASDVFELADNVIKDREPKISFTTGALAGEEFSIVKNGWREIDTTTREIEIVRNEIEYGGEKHFLPGVGRQPGEGDEFVLFDINMPPQYVARAEAELLEWGSKELEKKSVRQYSYNLEIDPRHIRRQGIRLSAGGRLRVTDEGASRIVRISKVSYPLDKPDRLSVELNDIKVGTFGEKVEQEIRDVTDSVQEVHRQAGAISRRAFRDAQEVAGMVDALSAPGLLAGDAEGQFTCTSVIRCNVGGDANKIAVTDGELKHALYAPAAGSGWKIAGGETTLDATEFPLDKPLFLFAVCPLAHNAAYIAAAQEMPEEEVAVNRFFRIGVLSSVFETTGGGEASVGKRTFNYTNRYSQIVGGNITTSVISDPARRLVIDLDNARITAREGAQISGRIDLSDGTIDGKTIIEGGRIKAESIDTDNLTVKELQTSDDKKRIAISKRDHSIVMYNEHNQLRLEISGETKNRMTDIIDTGGASSEYLTLDSLDVSSEATLTNGSSDFINTDTQSDSVVACQPFTVGGSIKPSLTIPGIRPEITFDEKYLDGHSGAATVDFSVVIEKEVKIGQWKSYLDLGKLSKSSDGINRLPPQFYYQKTYHDIAPGTYRIVYVYLLKSRVTKMFVVPGTGSDTGIPKLNTFLTPITSEEVGRTITTAPSSDDPSPQSGQADSYNRPPDPPVGPPVIDPPFPEDPPHVIVHSKVKATLILYTTDCFLEYSILRTSIFANGLASVWAKDKYFRILDGSEPNLIEARGTTQLLSQNGYSGLQITNEGISVRYKNAPWGGLMPPVDYIGHVRRDGLFISQWRAPGKNSMGAKKVNTGNYRITFFTTYTYNTDYIVLVTAFWGYGRMISRDTKECMLYLGDDDSPNDAEFYFIVLNVKNYLT